MLVSASGDDKTPIPVAVFDNLRELGVSVYARELPRSKQEPLASPARSKPRFGPPPASLSLRYSGSFGATRDWSSSANLELLGPSFYRVSPVLAYRLVQAASVSSASSELKIHRHPIELGAEYWLHARDDGEEIAVGATGVFDYATWSSRNTVTLGKPGDSGTSKTFALSPRFHYGYHVTKATQFVLLVAADVLLVRSRYLDAGSPNETLLDP